MLCPAACQPTGTTSHFPEIFEEDEVEPNALEDNNSCKRPAAMSRRKKLPIYLAAPCAVTPLIPRSRRPTGVDHDSGNSSSGSTLFTKGCTTSPRVPSPTFGSPLRSDCWTEDRRELETRRIREDFELATQRLQDVTSAFGTTRASLPPLDTNVFGIVYP
jgi:hypothetical protein